MSFKDCAVALVLIITIATPASAFAMTGSGGCSGLPVYYRALGALQGMTSACNMTIEHARGIVASYDGPAIVAESVAQVPRPDIGVTALIDRRFDSQSRAA